MEENKSAPEVETTEGVKEEKTPKAKKQDKKELLQKIEALESEIKEKDDRYLRMAAEYDNFRRRSREEREAVYDNAIADLFCEILPIIDNLERAANFDDAEKVCEGLLLTARATGNILSKLGIEECGKVGETFDPNLHEAILHIDDESYGEGEIVEVLQKGYKKGNRIIRFAMVKSAN